MRVQSTITPDDFFAFQRYGIDADTGTRAQWERFRSQRRLGALTLTLASGLWLWAMITFYPAAGEGTKFYFLVCAGVLAFFWTGFVVVVRMGSRSRLEAQIRDGAADPRRVYHQGPQSIALFPTHLRAEYRHHDVDVRWTGIVSVAETEEHIFIMRADSATFIVPKRDFGSGAQAAEFLALARRYHEGAVGHLVRDYFAARSAVCPECRHELRGNTELSCPGCGARIDLAPILAAQGAEKAPGTGPGL
jgi:hypothetical protein